MKIAVITTSRADWNSLGMVAKELRRQGGEVVIIRDYYHPVFFDAVGGKEGLTFDGFTPDDQRPITFMDAEGEGSSGILRLISDDAGTLEGIGSLLAGDRPDLVLLCGDRHETLLAAFCAGLMGIPVAHLAGGDVTGGSSDEQWRHAITKIATHHFPTHEAAAHRIIRMGEDPAFVHMFGSASIDRMVQTPVMPIAETTNALGLPDSRSFILANWQPETPVDDGLEELIEGLAAVGRPVVFVGVNADPGKREASLLIELNAQTYGWKTHANLPPAVYLSAMRHCACLVGNSSSGFYEAPYYGTPVINVGNRQRGRDPGLECMIHVPADRAKIADALTTVATDGGDGWIKEAPQYPYGHGGAAPKIADVILREAGVIHQKQFYEGKTP